MALIPPLPTPEERGDPALLNDTLGMPLRVLLLLEFMVGVDCRMERGASTVGVLSVDRGMAALEGSAASDIM